MRDKDIRVDLLSWLKIVYCGHSETGILQELKVPRPSARIDVAVVNGAIFGFEIKSDVDSLVRLTRQIPAYDAVCDKVCIVTTRRHIKVAERTIPKWWGIVACDEERVKVFRPGSKNSSNSVEASLFLLDKMELLSISKQIKGAIVSEKVRKETIVLDIASKGDPVQVKCYIRDALRRRQNAIQI